MYWKTSGLKLVKHSFIGTGNYVLMYYRPTYSGSSGSTQSDFELRTTLIGQLSASEQRIRSLESELRAAQLARGRAEQTVFDVNAEKLRLEAQNSEILQVNNLGWNFYFKVCLVHMKNCSRNSYIDAVEVIS